MSDSQEMKYDTSILHRGADRDPYTGGLSIPIYNASTYHQKDVTGKQEFEYGRSGNPTRKALEETLAALEHGSNGYAFASGMAAITTALLAFLKAGDHLIAPRDIYGGTYRLLTKLLVNFNIAHTFVDGTDLHAVEGAILPNSKVLFLESPSNPLLRVTDIKASVALAKKHGLLTMIDNTFLSPYFLRPLDLGVDISIHSATKFLGGHSDLIAGAVMTRTPELGASIYSIQNMCGSMLGLQDSWLLLRGIKTLSARMNAQQNSAQRVAEWLRKQSWVTDVYYPGLPSHPGYQIIKEQASGFGAVISCTVDTTERALRIMRNAKLWTVAVSLGGVESIMSYPCRMSHAAIPLPEREALGITDRLIRLSVGLEDAQDLIEDLAKSAL